MNLSTKYTRTNAGVKQIPKVADRTRELDIAGVEIKFGRLRGRYARLGG